VHCLTGADRTPILQDWQRFDTAAHRAAQTACVCSATCAVDAAARRAAYERLTRCWEIGDNVVMPIHLLGLLGRCYRPPTSPAQERTAAMFRG
jgi:hypothetical protein